MQIELGMDTLLGIAISVLVGLLGILVTFLYKISISLNSIDSTIDTKLGATNSTLERIERNLNNLIHTFSSGNSPVQSSPPQSDGGSTQIDDNDSTQTTYGRQLLFSSTMDENNLSPVITSLGDSDISVVIRTRIGSEVTIFEINTREFEDRAAGIGDEEVDLDGVPLPDIDTENTVSEIKQLSRDIFGVESELISNSYTTLIITPSTDYDDILEFRKSLPDLLQTTAEA